MKLTDYISLLIIAAAFILGVAVYPDLPSTLASHWNASGEVDGWSSKGFGVFFLPLLILALAILFRFIPSLDPKRENITKFRTSYDKFIIVFLLFMLAVYGHTILWNLGYQISIMIFMSIGLAVLFYSVGTLLENAEQNWFIGIKTPWTLSSKTVWNKTHVLGAKLYKCISLVVLLGAFFPRLAIWFVFIPIFGASLFLVVYSYFLFRKEEKQ